MGYPTISVCMIVKNEEKNLPRALRSVQGLADEVVVVDTGSTDRTVEIAKSFGAKVYFFEWCDDFSAARNESLRHATKDYILWLDADDEIEKKDHETIKMDLRKKRDHALFLHIISPTDQGETEAIQLRMFPNRRHITFEGKVHEQAFFSVKRNKIPTAISEARIIHYGYTEPRNTLEKLERNRVILEKEVAENPNNFIALFFLSRTLKGLGNIMEAEIYIDRICELAEKEQSIRDLEVLSVVVLDKADILCARGKTDEALALLERWERIIKKTEIFDFVIGEINFKKGNYERAYEKLYPLMNSTFREEILPVQVMTIRCRLMNYLGISALFVKDFKSAKRCFSELIQMEPENPANYHYLALCEEKGGSLEKAIQVCSAAAQKFDADLSFIKRRFFLELETENLEGAECDLSLLDGMIYDKEVTCGAIFLFSLKFSLEEITRYYNILQGQLLLPLQPFPEGYLDIRRKLRAMGEGKALMFLDMAVNGLLKVEKRLNRESPL